MSSDWNIPTTSVCSNTINPIRRIVDQLNLPLNPSHAKISLSIGDPSVYGNMKPHGAVVEAMKKAASRAEETCGYPASIGVSKARIAIANKFTIANCEITEHNVIIGSGCSQALDICINGLVEHGYNILVPTPGFSLYMTICSNRNIEARCYNLDVNKDWEVDISHLESLIDKNTRAILVNNPSNPCGTVYSKEHLLEILAIAEKYRLPIIADEIYANMTFNGAKFYPMAELTTEVPIISVGGIAKQYLVPGWRLGWLINYDRKDRLKKAFNGMVSYSQLLLGANSTVQSALPDILNNPPAEYYTSLNNQLERQANCCVNELKNIPSLNVVIPKGAMYILIGLRIEMFKDITDDVDFSRKLMQEQSVIVLPGQCFRAPNCFRIVCCAPEEIIAEASARIANFCKEHSK